MPRRATSRGGSADTERPLKWISPALGSVKRVSRLNSVVLPAPLGPIRAWMCPFCTDRSTLSTAVKPLKRLLNRRVPSTSSVMSVPFNH